ncbi:hypothetical protein ABH909_002179 [Pseudomonas sp. BS3782 TE3695]|uniref:hypothetical protein n=1 Tax=Pseudomonas sp. BS3782 TE3695 TaxID=3349323 RepID=UPI003D1BBA3A
MKHTSQYNLESKHSFLEKNWVLIVGVLLGAMTIFFLMALVIMSTFALVVPPGSRFIVITIIAFGLSFSGAFIGGNAAAKGKIPFVSEAYTAEFSAGGGVATFLIVFVAGSFLYKPDVQPPPSLPWDGKLENLKKAEAQVSNVDDAMIVRVNEKQIIEARYGGVPPALDILGELKKGQNVIEVEVRNDSYGGCAGKLRLRFNDMYIPDYEWSVDNPFAGSNSTCYSDKRMLNIQ